MRKWYGPYKNQLKIWNGSKSTDNDKYGQIDIIYQLWVVTDTVACLVLLQLFTKVVLNYDLKISIL